MTDETNDRRGQTRGATRRFGDALYGVLRFIARHVRGFYGAIITYLSFSFFIGVGAIWIFAAVAEEVLEGGTQSFDEAVLTWVATHRTGLLDQLALEVTALGNTMTLVVLVLAVGSFLWLTHHRYSFLLLVVALAGGGLVNLLLKETFDRPRPSVVEWGTEVSTASFPSGHAMSAMIVYASVAYLVGRLEPTRRMRLLTWTFAAVIITAIGSSRIYLGVHYPSDVVAGFIAGLGWTAFVVSGISALRYFSRRKPDLEKDERDIHKEPAGDEPVQPEEVEGGERALG